MNRQAAIELYRRGEEATVAALLDQSARLEALERRVAQLERDSTNSHKPPSSDGPKKKRGRAERGASGRKPGGQPGHPGHPPAPTPPEAIGQAVEHKPATCDSCGRAFSEADPTRVVERRRVVELPHIQPWVIQHVFYETQCPCGHETRLPVPDGVMTGVGETLQALMASLTSEARMSRRVLQKTLAEVFHVRCALGAIQNRLEDTSEALSPMTQELEAALPHESVVHSDETGSPHNRVGHWLWVFVTARFVFFTIQASRGSKVLKEVLGEAFAGILICDRFSAYLKYQKDRAVGLIQFCWAHLIREARALPPVMAQGSGELFSRRTRQHLGALFRLWHAFRRGHLSRAELIEKAQTPIQGLERLLTENLASPCREVAHFSKALLKKWDSLFTFVYHEGVEPTNNRAERHLRPGVQTRKVSYGTRSEAGQRLRARLLTVLQTSRMQGRAPLDLLTAAIRAKRHGLAFPSLLSAAADADQRKVA